jgi:hypothetical protein
MKDKSKQLWLMSADEERQNQQVTKQRTTVELLKALDYIHEKILKKIDAEYSEEVKYEN